MVQVGVLERMESSWPNTMALTVTAVDSGPKLRYATFDWRRSCSLTTLKKIIQKTVRPMISSLML